MCAQIMAVLFSVETIPLLQWSLDDDALLVLPMVLHLLMTFRRVPFPTATTM